MAGSVQKASSHVIWTIEIFTEEDTRNTVHRTMSPQSPSKHTPWDLSQFSQSPSAAPLYFPEFHWQSEISSLSKVILVLGKSGSRRAPNLGCRGLSDLGDLMFHQTLCRRCDAWPVALSWGSCQSPVAHSCSLLNHPNSFWMFKLNTKFDADSLLYSLILNAMVTQYTCSLNSVYCPHWLVQWSRHCSHMCIPVHSPQLPGYTSVAQSKLFLL